MAGKVEKKDGPLELVKTIVYALLIALAFRTILFQPFWIPSGSMKETLLIGDWLFVNKFAYGYSRHSCEIPVVNISVCPFIKDRWLASEPERGDVVVFRHPVNGSDFIKRLIGMPGDTVQMVDGRVVLNGTELPHVPAGTFDEPYERQGPMQQPPRCENAPVPFGATCTKSRATETLPGGRSYAVLNIDTGGAADNTALFTVPEGHYFFMGDNRDNSVDSRFGRAVGGVGFVPASHLIGRADRIVFSSAGKSLLYVWTWRKDRFLKAIE